MKGLGELKAGGQITIVASLSLTLILSLVFAVFESVSISALNVHIQQSCRLAAESVFSGYSNIVLDEFDILLLKKSDNIDGKVIQYIRDNLKNEKNVDLVSAEFDQFNMITDDAGENIRKEILAYMKCGIISEAVEKFMSTEEQIKKSEKISSITQQINACEETIYEMEGQILKLVQLVEGIETNEAGLVIRNGRPVAVSDYFAKAAVNGDVTMKSAGVDNGIVYETVNHVTTKYTDISELIKNMYSDVLDLEETTDEESDALGELAYSATYKKSFDKLEVLINGVSSKTEEALDVISQYKTFTANANTSIEDTEKTVHENRELIGEELGKELLSDLTEIKTSVSSSKRKLCDVEIMEEALKQKKIRIDNIKAMLPNLEKPLKQAECSDREKVLEQCLSQALAIENKNLKFDYSGIDFNEENEGLSAVRKVYSALTDGLVKLVLEEKQISEKSLEINDLASRLTGEYTGKSNVIYEALDTALYDEYILSRFKTYTDMVKEDGTYDESMAGEDLLEYSVEYILCGEDSDRENIKETMLRLSVIREGMNLAHLISDSTKRNQALALSTSLLGFTGNMAIIKGGQYFILTVWAYGETIMDLRQLYMGGKVEFAKRAENWQLTLENLLEMNLKLQEKKSDKGLSYEDYLRMLLFVEDTVEKNYQTMGAMELRLIGKGNAGFRMKDYVFAASGQAIFIRKGMKGYYTRQLNYSYV